MLRNEHIQQFVTQGYCVVETTLGENLVRRAKEIVWSFCPEHFDEHDPATWTGSAQDSCSVGSMSARAGRLKFRECARMFQSIRTLTTENPEILTAVSDLLRTEPSEGPWEMRPIFRGLYPILSLPDSPPLLRPHCDRHLFRVGAVLYLSDVSHDEGPLWVWPGSHWQLAPEAVELSHTNTAPLQLERAIADVKARTQPVPVTGRAGTVVLWHRRLLHAAGTPTRRGAVRYAALCDFKNAICDKMPEDGRVFDETWSAAVLQHAGISLKDAAS